MREETMNSLKMKHLVTTCGLLAAFGGSAWAEVYWLPGRIVGQSAQPTSFAGKLTPPSIAPNRVEGREFWNPVAVALDRSVSPPAIYVTDYSNHRVLGWRDATSFANGAMADIVLGQPDMTTTQPRGNGSLTSGLNYPGAVAVDSKGNVFVVDAGDNRILRYPAPFAEGATSPAVADLIIGQTSLGAYYANQSTSITAAPTASTIKTCAGCNVSSSSSGSLVGTPSLAFDAGGNLWFSDAGNSRILRYDAADVSADPNLDAEGKATTTIAAKVVLGHLDFATSTANPGRADGSKYPDRLDRSSLRYGGPLTFDASGNLYFSDDMNRVLVWKAASLQAGNGKAADGIVGLWVPSSTQGLPTVNQYTFGGRVSLSNSTYYWAGGPRGLFCVGDSLFVIDTHFNRIVSYDPLSTWQVSTTAGVYAVKMKAVFGQKDFNTATANGYPLVEPSASTYSTPMAGVASDTEVFLVDTSNNRVLAHPYYSDSASIGPATRVLGQYELCLRAANLIDGYEFGGTSGYLPVTSTTYRTVPLGPKAALDRSVSPPRLYVADTLNNRVLCFANARTAQSGVANPDQAILQLGQVDFRRSLVNSPTNDPNLPTASGLNQPAGILVDGDGNVWVSDTGNGRVLRYPNPFTRTDGALTPDLVLGAATFEAPTVTTPSRDRFASPTGLALTRAGNLVVADPGFNRVLLFKQPFSNGQAADVVLGQVDGASESMGKGDGQFSSPMAVALDSEDGLYVADTINSRIQVFDNVEMQTDGAPAVYSLAAGVPLGVTVSPTSGEIWVADWSQGVRRYPNYTQILLAGKATAAFYLAAYGAHSVLLDEETASIQVLDSANRIAVHYPQLAVVNGVSGFSTVAPGMVAQLTASGLMLDSQTDSASGSPLPTELADLWLTVDGQPAPLLEASGGTLRFIVPKQTPVSKDAEGSAFLLRRVSTGELLSFGRVQIKEVSPAVFYFGQNPPLFDSTGAGQQAQAKALNQDGSQNSSGNRAGVGQELTIFLTGYGNVPGLPDDGVAPDGEVSVDAPQVYLITTTSAQYAATVLSSTLDPANPGVWRVKIKVPQVNASGNLPDRGSLQEGGQPVRPLHCGE